MYCHLMVYMRIVLTTLVILTCLLGDNFVELTQHPLLKALADNATHATVGALTSIAYVVQLFDKISNIYGWFLIFTAFICSSLIDIDHFIVARSWYLEDAISITCRPFLHCSSLIIIFLIIYIYASSINYIKFSLFLGILLCAFTTHHTRDALRRGYWLYPFGHTNRISNFYYIFITIITPYLYVYIHNGCRSTFVQQTFGQYIKFNSDSYHKDAIKGYHYMQV